MGRRHRVHWPGAAHHIVARTADDAFARRHRSFIAETLIEGAVTSGCRVLAISVMPNHFHLLLFQGQVHLGTVMQPIMRRIAMRIQRSRRRLGHVFERRYRNRVCADVDHLRNSILYIHRNALKAGLCQTSADYDWHSHNDYLSAQGDERLAISEGLRIVCGSAASGPAELRDLYLQHFNAYCGIEDEDRFEWVRSNKRVPSHLFASSSSLIDHDIRLTDLAAAAELLIGQILPGVDMKLLRSNFKGREIASARTRLITSLRQRGYRTCDVARYLNVCDSTVSRVNCRVRYGR